MTENRFGTKLPLRPFQEQGVEFLVRAGRALLADEMGLGKTVQSIAAALELRRTQKITKVLVICPNSLKRQWGDEIKKFSDEEFVIPEGPPQSRQKQYGSFAFFTIINYELMLRDYNQVYAIRWDLVILDETQRIKNWRTATSKRIKAIKPVYRFALSGTPIENKLEELHSIMEFLDHSILGPFWRFSKEYLVWSKQWVARDRQIDVISGYKNVELLRSRIDGTMLRRRKMEVLDDLPPLVEIVYRVDMEPKQRKLYNTFRDELVAFISDDGSKRSNKEVFAKLSLLRQVCDSPQLVRSTAIPGKKIIELTAIIEDAISAGEKVLIFSQWIKMLRVVEEMLRSKKVKYCRLYGEMGVDERQKNITKFTEDESIPVFLSSDAGAYGVNLQVATRVVNIDLPWNPAILAQRVSRSHRMGVKSSVTAIHLVCRDSIEENILKMLREKKNLSDAVIDGIPDDQIQQTTIAQIMDLLN